jgi:peptidoglycan-N-acetylglucosamine deacetylase
MNDSHSNPPFRITTSWDDGHPLDLRLAEMLARHALRATFYIPRHCPPRATLSLEQLRELSQSFEIGAHTLDHVFLTDAPDDLARREIIDSKKWVEDVTGKPCRVFCPPAGKFSPRHVEWVREAGYAGFRTVELLSLDRPRLWKGSDLLELPTTVHAFPHRAKTYAKNAVRRRSVSNLWRYIRHGATSSDWGGLAERLLDRAARIGGLFHLWGHSWEIEETAQWQRLEEVLAMLGRYAGAGRTLTNGEVCAEHAAAAVGAYGVRPIRRG